MVIGMKMLVLIEREELDELFAVGPNDLKNHFLPKWMGIAPADVKSVKFWEIRRNGKIISNSEALIGGEYESTTHKDNFPKRNAITDDAPSVDSSGGV